MKKKVALCVSGYGVVNSPSLLNLLEFLHEIYDLTLILNKVSYIDFVYCREKYFTVRLGKLKFFNNFLKKKYADQDLIISVDPKGYCLSLDFFSKNIPKVYYSLELHLQNDHFGLDYPEKIRIKERENIVGLSGLIIQSEERARLFARDYKLNKEVDIFFLPVTYKGDVVRKKCDFLHKAFAIPENHKIALHLGGVGDWFSSLKFIDIFSEIEGWSLVFHGHYDSRYRKKMQKKIYERNVTNVYISNLYSPSMDTMHRVISSSDVGLAWYNNISKGFSTAGESSGKISAYLRYGLPIITKSYPSTKRAIQMTGCGVCISEESEVVDALLKINNRINFYIGNCYNTYKKKYDFRRYEKKLKVFFDSIIERQQ